MKKIMHSNSNMQWHEAIQIAAHNYNTFPSAVNGYSPFLLLQKLQKNRSKGDNEKITNGPPLKLYDGVLIQNHYTHGLEPKFHGNWKIVDFNSDRQVVIQINIGDCRVMSTRHVKKATFKDTVFLTNDLFKPTWKT